MIDKETVLGIANLACLYAPEDSIDSIIKELEETIAFADEIVNAKIDENLKFDSITGLQNVLREDVVVESFPQEEILKNAKDKNNGYFMVKKVVG